MSAKIAPALLRWFKKNGRHHLPWQNNQTPYRVWVSEIMLQQTQVRTVIPYYKRFMLHFPSLKKLAQAEQDDVLHLWTGLGYYARARNMHRTAQIIVDDYKGRFPRDMNVITSLPGIGRSTAGAILTIACKQRHPILDGNVKRVLARYFMLQGWPGKMDVLTIFWRYAEQETPKSQCAEYTQAIMDLGATICTRLKPKCHQCPLAKHCLAKKYEQQHAFPEKKPATTKRIVKNTIFLILENQHGELLMKQQPQKGIWGGLWIFPQLYTKEAMNDYLSSVLFIANEVNELQAFQHKFSHFDLNVQPIYCRGKMKSQLPVDEADLCWYSDRTKKNLGMAAPVKKIIQQLTK